MSSKSDHTSSDPLGVIETFSAGIFVVARHPWLLLLPVLLDLFFWLGPPLVLSPALVEGVTALFDPQGANAAILEQGLTADPALFYEGLQAQLSAMNLWTFLVPPILFWPSLVITGSGSGGIQLTSAGNVALIALLFSLVGVWLSFLWLEVVARGVRAQPLLGKPWRLLTRTSQHALRFIGILLLLLLSFLVILLPLSFVVGIIGLLLPGVGAFLAGLLSLAATWGVLWLGLHFYFTAGALVLDDAGIIQSLGNSVRIVRRFFWSALGLLGLSFLLSSGFQLIWTRLSATAAGHVTSVVGNAALGTAIAAAMLLFYAQRVEKVRAEEEKQGVPFKLS